MEFEEIAAKTTKRKRKSLFTIGVYVEILHDRSIIDQLTVPQLQLIVGMHGFKKEQRFNKGKLIEVVSTMKLIDPCWSTLLNDAVKPSGHVTLEEAMADLNQIGWNECHITSIRTIRPTGSASIAAGSVYAAEEAPSAPAMPTKLARRPAKPKLQRRSDRQEKLPVRLPAAPGSSGSSVTY